MNKDWLILVGAGASFGHHDKDKYKAPLGKDLAECLRKKDQRFLDIEKAVGAECGQDFEEWLIKVGANPEAFTSSLASVSHFFRQFKQIHKKSRYFELLSTIGDKNIHRVSFVSLNYESLLEMALRQSGYNLDWGSSSYGDDRFNSSKRKTTVPFYKPHGSSHFIACMANRPTTPRATTLDLTSKIDMETEIMDPTSMTFHEDVISVISAYEPEKRNSFNSTFIDEVRETTLQAAKSANLLLIIGIRHTPQDAFLPQVFNSALKPGLRIAYVGSNTDFDGYRSEFQRADVELFHLGERFDDSCLSKIGHLLGDTEQ